MSGGFKSGPPTELGPFLQRLKSLEERMQRQETRVPFPANPQTGNVIVTDSNGVNWQLGVTTSGATTWTQV